MIPLHCVSKFNESPSAQQTPANHDDEAMRYINYSKVENHRSDSNRELFMLLKFHLRLLRVREDRLLKTTESIQRKM